MTPTPEMRLRALAHKAGQPGWGNEADGAFFSACDPTTVSLACDVIEAARVSAGLSPQVPDGNAFGHDWKIANPVIAALTAWDAHAIPKEKT